MLTIEDQLRQYGSAVEATLSGGARDEVGEPSAPTPKPRDHRRGRRQLVLAGVMAAAAAVVALVIAVRPTNHQVVSTPSDAVSLPSQEHDPVRPFTFGVPNGPVRRVTIPHKKTNVAEFRRTGTPTNITLEIFPSSRPSEPTTTRQVGERSFVAPGTWSEADGTYWLLYTRLGTLPPQSDLDEFFAALRYHDGRFTVGAPYEAYESLDASERAWAIEDDSSLVVAFRNRDFQIADEAGPRSKVRGHPAVYGEDGLVWREDPNTVVSINPWVHLPNGTMAPHNPSDEGGLIKIANELVPINQSQFNTLPLGSP
jgi:hypothetical protein